MKQTLEKDPRTHAIIGAAMEVYNIIGSGYLYFARDKLVHLDFQKIETKM